MLFTLNVKRTLVFLVYGVSDLNRTLSSSSIVNFDQSNHMFCSLALFKSLIWLTLHYG